MSYAKIIKTVTSHLTAHGLPMDPIGWSKAVIDRISVGGPGVEHVERLRPLPLLLSEGERIRCAWGVDRVTGELRPSIEALSTMTPKLREHLGDGARAVTWAMALSRSAIALSRSRRSSSRPEIHRLAWCIGSSWGLMPSALSAFSRVVIRGSVTRTPQLRTVNAQRMTIV